mmetsp:Transcript_44138/g.75098  ORF Transcript_44138/g.75098 Transcript_44138/m.75098 type:complete len:294 (+) Transcript_44138:184-1065(+)
MPVMARPRMSACTSCVPSYVFTASRFITWRITWYSSLTPFPPSMSRATRATSKLFPHEFRFVMLIISGAAKPWSSSRPTCRQPCSPNATSVLMSASFFCTSWLEASGAPNCTRSSVYCRLVSRQKAALPSAPQLIPKRALFRQLKGPPKPRARGSWLACGTATSSMKIMPVTEARRLNLPSILGAESPGMSFSRMNPRITPSSSFAQMMNTSAMGLLVIQFFEPLNLHDPSAWRRALVSIDPGSEPWFGSVRPKHPTSRPDASSGRYLSFCSSLPNVLIGCMTRELWTLMADR